MDNVHIPILDRLLPEGVPRGRAIAVFFDPASDWYNLITAIAAKRLREGRKIALVTTTRFPDQIRAELKTIHLDPDEYERKIRLLVADWYSCLTGKPPTVVLGQLAKLRLPASARDEDLTRLAAVPSLKVEELSILLSRVWYGKNNVSPEQKPLFIEFVIFDNLSTLFSYNTDSASLKFLNTAVARAKQDKRLVLAGFSTKIHDEKVYASLEAMVDSVLDVTTKDVGGELRSFVRVRSFRDSNYQKGWYLLRKVRGGFNLEPEPHSRKKDAHIRVRVEG